MKKFDRQKHSLKFVSNPGERFKKIYKGVVQEDGSIELVEDHVEDTWKNIQIEAVGASLPEIIARATAGDPNAFRAGTGFYGDVVDMPKTYAEILNTVNDGKAAFDKMPVEVRQKFNFSFEEWFATYGTESWFNNMGFGNPNNNGESAVKEEVKTE